MGEQQQKTASNAPRFGRLDADMADVDASLLRAREFLLSRQHPDGYWCGELEADSMLEADYIFLHTLLESGDPGRLRRALAEMMRYQNDDGSWNGHHCITSPVFCTATCLLILSVNNDVERLGRLGSN